MNNDLQNLQGRWQVTTLEVDGSKMSRANFSEAGITIEGDIFVTAGMGAAYGGKISLDENSTPKKFELNYTEGPHSGKASLGLYRLDENEWTICIGFAGYKRPQDFTTSAGSGHALEILVRELN